MAVTFTFKQFEEAYTGEYNSTYYDETDTESFCQVETGLQTFVSIFQTVLHSMIFLLGMVGNGLMITVLLRRWHLLRITEIYLLHLALADLMLLITLPFYIAENATGWLFGNFLCKLIGLMKQLNLLCSSVLLACIGFDRYLAIVHAITSMQSRRRIPVHFTCIFVWLVCLASSLPNVVFLSVTENDTNTSMFSCAFHHHGIHAHNWALTIAVLEHVGFFLPLVGMTYCYTAVVVTLLKIQKSKAKKGAIRLALLVTLVFCFCWLPYNMTLLIQTMQELEVIKYKSCESLVKLDAALELTKSLGFSHCCLNPFLYAFVGVRFRNELIQLLCELGCGRVCMPFIRAQGHSRPSISDGVTSTSTTFN